MKMRVLLIPFFTLLLALPGVASAEVVGPFAPIIPEACRCEVSAPDYGCVLETVQGVIRLAINLGIVISVFALAYAGFLWMTSSTNAGNHAKAKQLLLNVFVGIAIMLTAWLIVDFIMKTLYNEGDSNFGPWNSILADRSGQRCIKVNEESLAITQGDLELAVSHSSDATGSGSNCPAAESANMIAFPASATQGETEYATRATVENFLAMRAAALQDGIDLKVVDGHRPESEQVSLWNKRATIGAVARPCTQGGNGSNHNAGVALDINVGCKNGNANCNTAAYRWLKANGSRWGFRNAIPSDPVHWSPSGR